MFLWGIKKYYGLKFVKYKNNFKILLTSYIAYDRIRKVETREDTITEKEKLLSLLDDDDIF